MLTLGDDHHYVFSLVMIFFMHEILIITFMDEIVMIDLKENDDYHSFEWHCDHSSQYNGNDHPFASCAKDSEDYPHMGEGYDHS